MRSSNPLEQVLANLQDVRMTAVSAAGVVNALADVRDGATTIKPFDISGISSITPRELVILHNSFEKQQPEAEAEGSDDGTE